MCKLGASQKTSRFFCVDEKNQLLQLGSVVAYAHRMAQYIDVVKFMYKSKQV